MKTELFGPPEAGSRRTWIWAVPILVFVLLIGGQIMILLPAKYFELFTRDTIETYPYVLYLIIGAFSSAALLFVLWIKVFERRSLASAGITIKKPGAKNYLQGYLSGLLMAGAVVVVVWLVGGYELEVASRVGGAAFVPILILMFAFMLQSGVEEFVFRGWMLGRIVERYGLVAGVLGNSLLFMLMHVEGDALLKLGLSGVAIFTFGTMLFSIFLSLMVIRQRSIWGAAAWHASWNWMFITWFGLPTTGIDLGLAPLIADLMPTTDAAVWLTGGADGPEGSFLTPVVLVIGCLLFVGRKQPALTT